MNVSVDEFFMVLEVLFKGMEQNDAAICFIVGLLSVWLFSW